MKTTLLKELKHTNLTHLSIQHGKTIVEMYAELFEELKSHLNEEYVTQIKIDKEKAAIKKERKKLGEIDGLIPSETNGAWTNYAKDFRQKIKY